MKYESDDVLSTNIDSKQEQTFYMHILNICMKLTNATSHTSCEISFELISFIVVCTVNQQILAAIKFGVSQNKVIWRLLNLASPRGPSMQCTIDVYFGRDKY